VTPRQEAATSVGVDPEEMAQRTITRSNLYGFLAAIYRVEPTADLLRQIKHPSLLEALVNVGVTLEKDFLGAPEEQLLFELAVEYTRVFIGPGKHISPHESVHTQGHDESLWGRSTVAVKVFIESVSIEFRPDYHGMPDHISVELELMQKFTEAEANAWQRGDYAEATMWLQLEQEFTDSHLARWVPGFCDQVVEQAELSFYREMAMVTKQVLEMERKQIERLAQQNRLHSLLHD
jgi:TorA maturation chaperone TorD